MQLLCVRYVCLSVTFFNYIYRHRVRSSVRKLCNVLPGVQGAKRRMRATVAQRPLSEYYMYINVLFTTLRSPVPMESTTEKHFMSKSSHTKLPEICRPRFKKKSVNTFPRYSMKVSTCY